MEPSHIERAGGRERLLLRLVLVQSAVRPRIRPPQDGRAAVGGADPAPAGVAEGGAGQGLITRLADGSSVTMRVEAVEEGLRTKVASLTDGGVDAIVLLCTGEFPSLRSGDVWLIEPDTVLTGYVVSLFAQVRVGMILPMAGQVDDARVKWRGLADPIFAFASPYSDDVEALIAAAYDLVDAGARALVLDCMGFSRRHREALRARGVEVPVLVANEVVGGVVRIAFS